MVYDRQSMGRGFSEIFVVHLRQRLFERLLGHAALADVCAAVPSLETVGLISRLQVKAHSKISRLPTISNHLSSPFPTPRFGVEIFAMKTHSRSPAIQRVLQ